MVDLKETVSKSKESLKMVSVTGNISELTSPISGKDILCEVKGDLLELKIKSLTVTFRGQSIDFNPMEGNLLKRIWATILLDEVIKGNLDLEEDQKSTLITYLK